MDDSEGSDIIIQTDNTNWDITSTVDDVEDVVHLGRQDVKQVELEGSRWSLNTILIICLGPLGVVLLVSYIVHWYQVAQKVIGNKKMREKKEKGMQHPKASAMLSIRALERETGGTFMDMAVDKHDEYGIQMSKDKRLAR